MTVQRTANPSRLVLPAELPFTLQNIFPLLQPHAAENETHRVLGAAKSGSSGGVCAERCVPGAIGVDTLSEHVQRYLFAMSYVKGADVLDIACGSGYGAAMLCAAGARSVTGVDISQDAVNYAISRYEAANLKYVRGDAQAIPLASGSVDAVISYETVEHVPDWRGFLKEARRVLKQEGVFLVSTPNRTVTSYGRTPPYNPHHQKEFTPGEFVNVLGESFNSVALFSQLPVNRFKVKARYFTVKALSNWPSLKAKLRKAVASDQLNSELLSLISMMELEELHKLVPYQGGRIQIPTFVIAVCR